MTDEKPWPNQVELCLDNRQIFLLFFASAVLLSLVFALGVVVGKRMDTTPARAGATDPLALLDQMGDDGDESLSYHQALSPEARGPGAPDTAAEAPTAAAPAPVAEAPAAAAPSAPPAALVKAPARVAQRPIAEPEARPARKVPAPPAVAAVERAAEQGKGKDKDRGAKPAKVPEPAPEGEGTYTLQLSSFQERREAEAFMEKLRKEGLKPYLTPTTIPGRGVWYRVRVGHFKSWDDALAAKQSFEQTRKIIAYVSKN